MHTQFDEHENDKLDEIRVREEEDLAELLSSRYGLTYTDLTLHEMDADALRTIPEEQARGAEVVAFAKNAKNLSIALRNPNNPALAKVRTDLQDRGFILQEFLVSKKSLDHAYERYADLSLTEQSKVGGVTVGSGIASVFTEDTITLSLFKAEVSKTLATKSFDRVSHVFELILTGALLLRASDIHLEPEEADVLMRFRIDGELTEAYRFDSATYHQLNSRIKILSGTKLNVTNRSQDGRFSLSAAKRDIEIRSSFIPGNHGESIVMRILDPERTKVSYKGLGIHPKLLERLEVEIHKPHGMLLNTGPTGSGKTTTLYAFLRAMNSPETKIITIEDPIEYHLDGIVQTQVVPDVYTFAEGLRSIVRQDPDIIMVGEIRDGETASIAIQAALTGHFVFSTLHTNNAAGTFPRLVDLGADPKSFGSAVTVSMAQRLVRTLDPNKKKERPLTDTEKAMIAKIFEPLTDKSLIPEKIETVWEPAPESEDETGYKGRMGLHEAIFMDDEMATLLRDNPPENEIAKFAAKQGYLNMAQDGIIKALNGLTSLSEVASTVDLPR
jgi:type II secretory ATPase GspE/PulE/Tfp pilus assembly ATPase PilB-like protein